MAAQANHRARMQQDEAESALAPNLYFDRLHQKPAAKILPGEYYVTGRDMVLVTVLGSCVAACICDPVLGIGGMNHFLLPESAEDRSGSGEAVLSASARYGSYAMELLINQLIKIGAKRERLQAKVFGGGNVLASMQITNVGETNAAFVVGYLARERIPIVAKDLVDIYPRKVYYFPKTGLVRVKKLKDMHNDTIVRREVDYRSRLKEAPVGGQVELF